MRLTLVIFGYLAALTGPGLCCGPIEYQASDGQCCPMCAEGTVVRRDCTALAGTRCRACGVNESTYMNKPNGLDKCFLCTSCDQGHGLFAQKECTATTNTVCDVLNGYFCKVLLDDTGCSLAQEHKHCNPGEKIKTPGTKRTDTACESCQPGYFSKDGVNCTQWTHCSENQRIIKEGSTSEDIACGTASRNHYVYIPVLLCALTLAGVVVRGRLIKKHSVSITGE